MTSRALLGLLLLALFAASSIGQSSPRSESLAADDVGPLLQRAVGTWELRPGPGVSQARSTRLYFVRATASALEGFLDRGQSSGAFQGDAIVASFVEASTSMVVQSIETHSSDLKWGPLAWRLVMSRDGRELAGGGQVWRWVEEKTPPIPAALEPVLSPRSEWASVCQQASSPHQRGKAIVHSSLVRERLTGLAGSSDPHVSRIAAILTAGADDAAALSVPEDELKEKRAVLESLAFVEVLDAVLGDDAFEPLRRLANSDLVQAGFQDSERRFLQMIHGQVVVRAVSDEVLRRGLGDQKLPDKTLRVKHSLGEDQFVQSRITNSGKVQLTNVVLLTHVAIDPKRMKTYESAALERRLEASILPTLLGIDVSGALIADAAYLSFLRMDKRFLVFVPSLGPGESVAMSLAVRANEFSALAGGAELWISSDQGSLVQVLDADEIRALNLPPKTEVSEEELLGPIIKDSEDVKNFVEVWGYRKEGDAGPTCRAEITVRYVGVKTKKKPGMRPGSFSSEIENYHAYIVRISFRSSTGRTETMESEELKGNPPTQQGSFVSVVGQHMPQIKRAGKAGALMGRKTAPSVLAHNLKK